MTRAWNRRRSSLTGDRDPAVRAGCADGGHGGEEGVRGDDQSCPAAPGLPAAVLVLVLVEAEAGLRRLEGFLDAPTSAGNGEQVVQGNGLG